jgi:2-polyprenyl-6-methoxyphenol hydroxylase-like FAD-dependent oxidoreductase
VEEHDHEHQRCQRAVIIGSGMAGLASAAALAPLFEEVVIIERDNVDEVTLTS